MRSPACSGKSTKAKEIYNTDSENSVMLSTDEFFMKNGRYDYDISKIKDAHLWNQDRANIAMSSGVKNVIIDNTNINKKQVYPYFKIAMENGYNVEFIEPDWTKDLRLDDGKWNADFIVSLTDKRLETTGKCVPADVIRNMVKNYDYNINFKTMLEYCNYKKKQNEFPYNLKPGDEVSIDEKPVRIALIHWTDDENVVIT